ncbi:hypothetical protein CHS0354_026964 [Potamilus streckersoni]|uniref:Uncharacterized protein n=1 Tax=Potamilus streckersoni TaxID=2493646 RepID=A0AAE0SCR4_9BIVA|nr:hypothetical protein CHS0354_026964 [Potamilus streckersoni]
MFSQNKKLEEILDLAVNTLRNQRPRSAPVTLKGEDFFDGEHFFESDAYNCLLDVSPLITCRTSEAKTLQGNHAACSHLRSGDLNSKSETQVHQGVDVYIPPLCLEQEDEEIGDVPDKYRPSADSWPSDEIRVSSSTESLSRLKAPKLAWKYPELRLNLPKDEDDEEDIRINHSFPSSFCSSLSISSSSSDCSSISYDEPIDYLSSGLEENDTWLFDRITFHPCLSTVMERQTTSTVVEEIECIDGEKSIASFDMTSPDYVANVVKMVHETNSHFTLTNRSPKIASSSLTYKAEETKMKVELTICKEEINQQEASKIQVISMSSTPQNNQAGATISKTDSETIIEHTDDADVNVLLKMTSGFQEDRKSKADIAKNLEEITMIACSKNQVEIENIISPISLLFGTENLVMEPNKEITCVLSTPKEQMENKYSLMQIEKPIHSIQQNAVSTDKKRDGKILALGSVVRRSVSDVQVSKEGIAKEHVMKATSQIEISNLVATKDQILEVKRKQRSLKETEDPMPGQVLKNHPEASCELEKAKSCEDVSTFKLDKKQFEKEKSRKQIYNLKFDKSHIDLEKSDVKVNFNDTGEMWTAQINLPASIENKVSEAASKENVSTTSISAIHVGLLNTTNSMSPQKKVTDQDQYTEKKVVGSQGQVFTVTIDPSLHWIFKTPNEMLVDKPMPLAWQNIVAINKDCVRTVNVKENQVASVASYQQVSKPGVSKGPASRSKSQIPVRKRATATLSMKQTRRPVVTKSQIIQASNRKQIINSSTSEGMITSSTNKKVIKKMKSRIPVASKDHIVKRVSHKEIESPVSNHQMVESARDIEINAVTSTDGLQESTHDLNDVWKNTNDSNRKQTPESLVTAVYIKSTKIILDESTCKSPKETSPPRFMSPIGLEELFIKPQIVADKESDLFPNASPSTTIVSSMMMTVPDFGQNQPYEIPKESQGEEISAQNRINCSKTLKLQADVHTVEMPLENLSAVKEEACDTPNISTPILSADDTVGPSKKDSNGPKSPTPTAQSPHTEQFAKKKIEDPVSPVNKFDLAAESLNVQLESFAEDDDLGGDVESLHSLYNELMADKAFAEEHNENLQSSFKKECEMLQQIMKLKASMEEQIKSVQEHDASSKNIEDFINLDEQLQSLKWIEEHQYNFICVLQREIENEAKLWAKLDENAKKKSAAKPKIEPRMTANALRLKFKNILHKMDKVHEVNSEAIKNILARMTMMSAEDKQEILAMMATPQPPKESKPKKAKPGIRTQKGQQTLAIKTLNADNQQSKMNKRQNSVKVQVTGNVSSVNRADHTVKMANRTHRDNNPQSKATQNIREQISPIVQETSIDQSTWRQNQIKSKTLSDKCKSVKASKPKGTLSGKTRISKLANDEEAETGSSLPYKNKIDFKKGGTKYQIKVGLNESALKNSKQEQLPSIMSDESLDAIVSKRPCNKVRLSPVATEWKEDIVQTTFAMENIHQPSPLNATVVDLSQHQETYLKAIPDHDIQKAEMLDKEMLTVKTTPRQKQIHKNEAVKKVENKTREKMSVKEVNCEKTKEKEFTTQRKKSIGKDVRNENPLGKSMVMKTAGEKVKKADLDFYASSSSKLDIVPEPLEHEEEKDCIPVDKLSNLAKTETKKSKQLMKQKVNLSHQPEVLNHGQEDKSGIQSDKHKPIIKFPSVRSDVKPNSITKLRQNMSKIVNTPIIDPSKTKGAGKTSVSHDELISNLHKDHSTHEADIKITALVESKSTRPSESAVHQPISAPKDRGPKVPPTYANWEPPEPMQKQLERYATLNAVKIHKDQAKARQPRSKLKDAPQGKLLPKRENMPQPRVPIPLSVVEKTRKGTEKACKGTTDGKSAGILPTLKAQPKKYLSSGNTHLRKSING